MPDVTVFLACLVTLLIGYVLLKNLFSRLPPGPWGLPLLGCWPWMSDYLFDFLKLGKGYGEVFTVYILNTPVVVLNSTKAIHEALGKNQNGWAGRPYSYEFELVHLNPGILFKGDYTEIFKARKKFAMANLKKFGYGLPRIQERIQAEIDAVLEGFRRHKAKPFPLKEAVRIHAANVVTAILFDLTFDPDDKDFHQVLQDTTQWMTTASANAADVLPIMRFLPRKCDKPALEATRRLVTWFTGIIDERRAAYDPDDLRSFVDVCFKNDFDNAEILNYIISFWFDGTDTTVEVIRFWVFYMAHNLDVQAKAQDEVDRVLAGRQPTQADKKNLHYLEATLMETIRVTSPIPISLPLKTTTDVEILGYRIPKDAIYFANWTAVHNDPVLFENPDVFNPERFILEDGTCDTKNGGFVGFGIGKRSCIGEPQARLVMFLFLANFLQNFTFTFPEGEAPSSDFSDLALPGAVTLAGEFNVVASPR